LRSLLFDQEKKGLTRYLKKDEESILQCLWKTDGYKSTAEMSSELGIPENRLQRTLRSLRRRKIVNKQSRRNSPVKTVWRAELKEKELASRLIEDTLNRLYSVLPEQTLEVIQTLKKTH
jgi:DNA-binding HxlR family transcriptional regulator